MLKLGKLTDYAIVVMTHLARHASADGCAALSAAAVAQETAIPEPTVAKVLKLLARQNLLTSVRGVAGGYRLSRPAQTIAVGEVIEAMDGPVAIVSCVEPQGHSAEACGVSERCAVRGKWAPVNDAIRAALYAVTLADLAAPAACAPRARIPGVFKPFTPSSSAEATHASHD